jgi:UTP--glucose-1-phosphate uridylyltransferase
MPEYRKISKAVIPAAGFGTRMLPATKALPKEMLPVAGKPLIQYAVEEAAASGIETVVIVIRNHKSLIQAHFARDPELESFLQDRQLRDAAELIRHISELVKFRYIEQEKPFGLAHAICCARPLLDEEPFVVLLPDVIMVHEEPVTRQLIRTHEQYGGSVIAIREIESEEMSRHGIVRIESSAGVSVNQSSRITGLLEKPSAVDAPSRLGVFGRYLIEPGIWDAIEHTTPDPRGEVQVTDALNLFCQTNLLSGVRFQGRHYDAGDRLGYFKANIELSLHKSHLRNTLLSYLSELTENVPPK